MQCIAALLHRKFSEIDDSNVGPLASKASVLTPELIPVVVNLVARARAWMWMVM